MASSRLRENRGANPRRAGSGKSAKSVRLGGEFVLELPAGLFHLGEIDADLRTRPPPDRLVQVDKRCREITSSNRMRSRCGPIGHLVRCVEQPVNAKERSDIDEPQFGGPSVAGRPAGRPRRRRNTRTQSF